jgi:hypothetical protein
MRALLVLVAGCQLPVEALDVEPIPDLGDAPLAIEAARVEARCDGSDVIARSAHVRAGLRNLSDLVVDVQAPEAGQEVADGVSLTSFFVDEDGVLEPDDPAFVRLQIIVGCHAEPGIYDVEVPLVVAGGYDEVVQYLPVEVEVLRPLVVGRP